jgi:hypothetical protein
LRRGVAAFGGKKQVLYGAALHQSIQTTGRAGVASELREPPQRAFSGDCRAAGLWIERVAYPPIAASSAKWVSNDQNTIVYRFGENRVPLEDTTTIKSVKND